VTVCDAVAVSVPAVAEIETVYVTPLDPWNVLLRLVPEVLAEPTFGLVETEMIAVLFVVTFTVKRPGFP
jgi:hypothetical protein